MLRIAQRSRLRIDRASLPARIGCPQHAESFGVRRHDAVLDPVVNHLYEMPRSARPTVQIPLLSGVVAQSFETRRARDSAGPGRQGLQDGVELTHRLSIAADHHAVPSLEAPYPPARTNVDVAQAMYSQHLRSSEVIDVVRVSAVDHCISGRKQRPRSLDGHVDRGRGNHQPQETRRAKFGDEFLERGGSDRPLTDERLHGLGHRIEHDALMPRLEQPAHHVSAHASQPNHS
jgi:hypothetical protein